MISFSRGTCFLLLCTGLIFSGCNKTPAPGNVAPAGAGGNPANASAAPVNRWPDRAAMLAAAPPEKLVTKEVKVGDETYLLDVPAGSKITTPDTDTIINVEIAPEKQYNIRWAPENIVFFKKLETQDGHDKFLFLDDDTMVALKSDGKIRASMNLHDAYRDLGVRIGWAWNGKDWTEQDFMLALKSAATLRVKTPYETDPAAVAKRLRVWYSPDKEAPEKAKTISFRDDATMGHFKLLKHFPNIEEVRFNSTAGFNEHQDALTPLTKLPQLRLVHLHTGSPPSDEMLPIWLDDLAKCPNIEELELQCDLRVGREMEALGKLTKLRKLDFRVNQEGLNSFQALTTLAQLEELKIWLDNDDVPPILGDCWAALAKLPKLESLIVDGGIKGMLDADLAKLATLPKLKRLVWKSNDLAGQASPNLQAASIQELELEGNYEKGLLTKEFIAGLPTGLKQLELRRFQLSEDAAAALASLPQLESLVLMKCPMKRAAVLKLGDSKSLKKINRGYDEEPASKKAFDELKKARPELDL